MPDELSWEALLAWRVARQGLAQRAPAAELGRTWAMRGTLHLLPAGELATWVGAQGVVRPRYEMASR